MKRFFKIQDPNKILASDYEYYGKLLLKNDMDSLAIINLEKSITLDSNKAYNYEEIAKIYSKHQNHKQSARYYRLVKTNTNPERLNVDFNLGKEYFYAGNEYKVLYDSLVTNKDKMNIPDTEIADLKTNYEGYFMQADSCFEKVSELSSKSYLGYLWRARTLQLLDPEAVTDSAKIMYEKVMSIIEAGDPKKNKREVIESYRYFGSYYFFKCDRELKTDMKSSQADKKISKGYFEKILELDPNDQQAKTVLQALNQKQ
jgi:hypothetical protein